MALLRVEGASPVRTSNSLADVRPVDPLSEYVAAVTSLEGLTAAVERQERYDEVLDAVAALRLAVAQAYEGHAAPRRGRGARSAILDYLRNHLDEWVSGDELAAVSGIGEWARRVRELRVELGYEIEEQRGYYRLTAAEPDESRKARWQTVTDVRETEGPPRDRARRLLERLVGQAVGLDELARAARAKDPERLARELREVDHLPVEMPGDAPDLGTAAVRLPTTSEAFELPPTQRLYGDGVRARVFRRDGHRCNRCGRDHASSHSTPDGPFYLLVRHVAVGEDALPELPVHKLTDLALLETRCNGCYGR